MKLPKLPGPLTMSFEERAIYNKAVKVAEAFIKEKIDLEGKFVPDAMYEAKGSQLREYLAYVYRCGKIDGVQAAHKARKEMK